MRRLLLALLASLVACGGNKLAQVENPCALVTAKEVEAATGGTVARSGLVPDERLRLPREEPNPCEYVTDGKHTSITVSVHPHTAAGFAGYRGRDPLNTETVEGIGDEAFTLGLAALYVRVGNGYFVLVTQNGAGRDGIRDLRELALAALERIGAQDSE